MTYQYQPLGYGDGQFRLLKVLPGEHNSLLRCSLIHTGLKELPTDGYETISYAWGDPQARGEIEIDGSKISIPASGVAALTRMRLQDDSRLLFLDASCVDQSNLEERAQQVLFMHEIYANSRCNLIYLGEEDDYTAAAARSIHAISEEIRREADDIGAFRSMVQDLDKRNARRSSVGFIAPETVDFEALDRFFGRSWFRRLWVTLETLTAPDNICFCGEYTFHLIDLLKISAWLHFKSFYIPRQVANIVSNRLWTWWIALDDQNDTAPGQCGGFQTFLQILTFASSRETSDERDRVFALHRLFPGRLPSSLLPDYQRPLIDLMCDATRQAFITANGDIDFGALHYVHHNDMRELDHGTWPSWVPEWAQYFNDPGMFIESFSAGGKLPLEQACEADTSSHDLILKGHVIGTIDTITQALSNDVFQDREKLLGWLTAVRGKVSERSWKPHGMDRDLMLSTVLSAAPKHEDGAITQNLEHETYVQCLLRHLDVAGIPAPGLLREPASSTPMPTTAGQSHWIATRAARMYDNMWLYGIERLVFGTDTEFLGLGPNLTKAGDLLVVVAGGPWPLVLRPRGDGTHRFVGTSYVHGIMYGEAAQEHKDQSREDEIFILK